MDSADKSRVLLNILNVIIRLLKRNPPESRPLLSYTELPADGGVAQLTEREDRLGNGALLFFKFNVFVFIV